MCSEQVLLSSRSAQPSPTLRADSSTPTNTRMATQQGALRVRQQSETEVQSHQQSQCCTRKMIKNITMIPSCERGCLDGGECVPHWDKTTSTASSASSTPIAFEAILSVENTQPNPIMLIHEQYNIRQTLVDVKQVCENNSDAAVEWSWEMLTTWSLGCVCVLPHTQECVRNYN